MDHVIVDGVKYTLGSYRNEYGMKIVRCASNEPNIVIKHEVIVNNVTYTPTTIDEDGINGYTKTLYIPANVTAIHPFAFLSAIDLEEIIVSKDNPMYESIEGCLYIKQNKQLIKCPDNYQKQHFEVPHGTTRFSDQCFSSCKNLKSVTFPSTLKEIGTSIFAFCDNLETVYLNVELKALKSQFIWNCPNLTSIYIPKGFRKIPGTAFKECPNLTLYCEDTEFQPDWSPNLQKKFNIVFKK